MYGYSVQGPGLPQKKQVVGTTDLGSKVFAVEKEVIWCLVGIFEKL